MAPLKKDSRSFRIGFHVGLEEGEGSKPVTSRLRAWLPVCNNGMLVSSILVSAIVRTHLGCCGADHRREAPLKRLLPLIVSLPSALVFFILLLFVINVSITVLGTLSLLLCTRPL